MENKNNEIIQLVEKAKNFTIGEKEKSYFTSYSYFIDYFTKIESGKIEIENLVIGIHFVYGWMPTIFKFRKEGDYHLELEILNRAKRNDTKLDKKDYETLKALFNHSLVGTSKLLHFINPDKFAIWDSRVHNYLKSNIKSTDVTSNVGDVSNYVNYLNYLSEVTNSDKFAQIYNSVSEKIKSEFKYEISNYRAIEVLMFINGKK